MNDLMRPAMYEAWHGVQTVTQRSGAAAGCTTWSVRCANPATGWRAFALAGNRSRGDLLALMSAGAYGMTMASNYNTRGRAAEVMVVDGGQAHLIRQRENPADSVLRWKTCWRELTRRQAQDNHTQADAGRRLVLFSVLFLILYPSCCRPPMPTIRW